MQIIYEKRKSIKFSFLPDGSLLVTAPFFLTETQIREIVNKNAEKIGKLKKSKENFQKAKENISEKELLEKGRSLISKRLPFWQEKMGVKPKTVKITSAEKRLGSCSEKGGICFSKYLFLRNEKEIDYVFVHELAHLKYLNHSKSFYKFIESVMPDYKAHIKSLKRSEFQ